MSSTKVFVEIMQVASSSEEFYVVGTVRNVMIQRSPISVFLTPSLDYFIGSFLQDILMGKCLSTSQSQS